MLVTLQQASDHLRRDTTADDADLARKIHQASAAVLEYLKQASPWAQARDSAGQPLFDSAGNPLPEVDSAGEPVIHPSVEAAVLIMTGYLYRLRDSNPDEAFEQGYLPRPVTALLYPLRDPALE